MVLWEKSPNKVKRTEASAIDIDHGPFMLLSLGFVQMSNILFIFVVKITKISKKKKNLSSKANNAACKKKIGVKAVTSVRAH